MPSSNTAASWTFGGLRIAPACRASGRVAGRWRTDGGEWVRPVVTPRDWRRPWTGDGPEPSEWAVDFPPAADERAILEAGVAGQVFLGSGARVPDQGPAAELRIALAKCDRYLVTPAGSVVPRWRWVPAAMLPVGRLVVVARDDDFLAGVLASGWLGAWARAMGRRIGAALVGGFPLPWSPELARGSFTREQEERRDAVVRSWRALGGGLEDFDPADWALDDLDAAVAAVYGWPSSISKDDGVARLVVMARE